jgi:hypothetical protein
MKLLILAHQYTEFAVGATKLIFVIVIHTETSFIYFKELCSF